MTVRRLRDALAPVGLSSKTAWPASYWLCELLRTFQETSRLLPCFTQVNLSWFLSFTIKNPQTIGRSVLADISKVLKTEGNLGGGLISHFKMTPRHIPCSEFFRLLAAELELGFCSFPLWKFRSGRRVILETRAARYGGH